jgi:nitrate/nitrite transporter NarK
MAVLVVFSIFCQQSCGLSFGIVPFVSKRSTGLVSGFVGSGGNVGGAVTQVRPCLEDMVHTIPVLAGLTERVCCWQLLTCCCKECLQVPTP